MSTALLIAVILAAVAACPVMAVIQRRRGREGCCVPSRSKAHGSGGESLADLKAERERVQTRITGLEQNAATGDSVRR